MNDFLTFFMNSETPFLILFAALFWFYIRESKQREKRMEKRIDETQIRIEKQIEGVETDLKTMLTIWKILIDKELERREKENGNF
jgi:hypothetical protein